MEQQHDFFQHPRNVDVDLQQRLRCPVQQHRATLPHEGVCTDKVNQPTEKQLGDSPADQTAPARPGHFVIDRPEHFKTAQAEKHIDADLIQAQRQRNQERRHQPLQAARRVTKGDGVDHRHHTQGHDRAIVLIGQVLQEERAVPER
ncbi:hypothetical protein D3C80_1629490 [compost metagenome]